MRGRYFLKNKDGESRYSTLGRMQQSFKIYGLLYKAKATRSKKQPHEGRTSPGGQKLSV
jgi:hypothetical protein